MDEGIAVIIAAAMAILGIFYTSRQQRKLLRKQHTYQVIEKLNDWPEFDKKMEFARSLIKAKRIPRLCEDDDKSDCDQIDWLLNYYEFLASAIIAGDIDEGLARSVEETRLCRVYLRFFDYIDENRADADTPALWENLEFICYRWHLSEPDIFDRLLDGFRLRPSTARFHADRPGIHDLLKAASLRQR